MHFGPTLRGGVAVGIVQLCGALSRAGHKVGLLCNGGVAHDLLRDTEVDIFPRKFNGGTRGVLKEIIPTARVLSAFRPDILHVHGRGPSLVSIFAGRYPDVFTLHNATLGDHVGRFDTGLIRRLFSPVARKMVIMSEQQRAYCTSELGLADDRLVLVPTGVDVEHFAPCDAEERGRLRTEFGVGPDELLFLYVGRLHPQKQPEAVVRLAEALRARGDDRVRFVMIGDGPLRGEIEADVERSGLADRVTLLGYQDPLTAFQAADLLLLPSRYEGYGLVAVEAMAAGCPVLRSRTAGFDEQIEEGVTGFGSDVDVDDFVRKAIAVYERAQDLPRIAANARNKARRDLNVEAQARNMAEVYHAVLSKRRSRH
jgi:glycosyltransferase involved in cell wall biosynthesis